MNSLQKLCYPLSDFHIPHFRMFPMALKNKTFIIKKRGEIKVKGKGRMTTYFLERNVGVSEQQIMGVSDRATGARQQDGQMSFRPGLFAVLILHLRIYLNIYYFLI